MLKNIISIAIVVILTIVFLVLGINMATSGAQEVKDTSDLLFNKHDATSSPTQLNLKDTGLNSFELESGFYVIHFGEDSDCVSLKVKEDLETSDNKYGKKFNSNRYQHYSSQSGLSGDVVIHISEDQRLELKSRNATSLNYEKLSEPPESSDEILGIVKYDEVIDYQDYYIFSYNEDMVNVYDFSSDSITLEEFSQKEYVKKNIGNFDQSKLLKNTYIIKKGGLNVNF